MLGTEMRSNNSNVYIERTSLASWLLASALFATIWIQNLKIQLETQKNKGGITHYPSDSKRQRVPNRGRNQSNRPHLAGQPWTDVQCKILLWLLWTDVQCNIDVTTSISFTCCSSGVCGFLATAVTAAYRRVDLFSALGGKSARTGRQWCAVFFLYFQEGGQPVYSRVIN